MRYRDPKSVKDFIWTESEIFPETHRRRRLQSRQNYSGKVSRGRTE